MRVQIFAGLVVAASTGIAGAQDGFRDSDVRLSQAALTEYLSGQILEFYSGGFGTYRADGSHDYRYSIQGERVQGTYEVNTDSQVCTTFTNGFSRCDYVVLAGERYVMIIENGERYPIRTRSAIE